MSTTHRTKVGVVGYGVVGKRVADGVALQPDMELVGIADVAPTSLVAVSADREFPLFAADPTRSTACTQRAWPCQAIWMI